MLVLEKVTFWSVSEYSAGVSEVSVKFSFDVPSTL